MTEVYLNLTYPQLSQLIQQEANKQNIQVKGYDIKIRKLVIDSHNHKLRITGEIDSKWNAFFDFSAIPVFNREENKLDLQDISLDLDAKNLIFKGILKLAKRNILSRMEKIIEQPISSEIDKIKVLVDRELSKAPLPYNLNLQSITEELQVLGINALEEYLKIALAIEQKITIEFHKQEA